MNESIIYIPNPKAKRLLDFIFMIQPPIAPVYIINDLNMKDHILDNILDNIEVILQRKSFLNLF